MTSYRGRHMLAASPPTRRLRHACCCSPKRPENPSSSPAVTCGYGHVGRRRNARLGGHAAAGAGTGADGRAASGARRPALQVGGSRRLGDVWERFPNIHDRLRRRRETGNNRKRHSDIYVIANHLIRWRTWEAQHGQRRFSSSISTGRAAARTRGLAQCQPGIVASENPWVDRLVRQYHRRHIHRVSA